MPEMSDGSLPISRRDRVDIPQIQLDFRSAQKRIMDFREVVVPFDVTHAKSEASRCIHCPDPPCIQACPLNNPIPSALWQIEKGDFIEAAELFFSTSNMPRICGRICPQEQLCEGSCVLNASGEAIHIGALEAFVTDYHFRMKSSKANLINNIDKKVAVIGAGPAGLACAEEIALKGYSVTVFEAKPRPGGLLMYGIPGFKLEYTVLAEKISQLYLLGINFEFNITIGEEKVIDDLIEQGFDAVFIGVGAGVDSPMKIPGEDLNGVYNATEFLVRGNVDAEFLPEDFAGLPVVGEKVAVIGGGDTASDCVRTARRLGAVEVYCLYRRTEKEMPGMAKDRKMAREEGTQYLFLTQPVGFHSNNQGQINQVECVKMIMGDKDKFGRRRPNSKPGSNFLIDIDTVILALGYMPYASIGETTPGLETYRDGLIVIDKETCMTNREGIFAGGDAVNGPDLVVTAIADGRKAANAIHQFLTSK
ncbi:MAG: NAD(P)-dependent oxidoreductase [Anaerolineaceae bacterium]|nr:NAD(P)-dependent oxidoreductase [Anaerolineaceae bacterium]